MRGISNGITTLNAAVLASLRSAVVSGELLPGSLHSVQALAAELGVSRTPVREALIKMAEQGMVRFERNRGVRILQTTVHDLEEVFELRLLLEVPAARRACEKFDAAGLKELRREFDAMERAACDGDEVRMWEHDRGFHRTILEATGNKRLAEFVDSMRDMVLKRGVSTAESSRTMLDIVAEHLGVLERLEARDPEGAAEAMCAHLQNTSTLLLTQEAGDGVDVDLAWTTPAWTTRDTGSAVGG
ncbi:MAG: GntR family transcriptional regulator [Gemmatimonadales bacterium]|jgi:DNA-binding GntR family transcriptional regulator